jgi:hypothetical protein
VHIKKSFFVGGESQYTKEFGGNTIQALLKCDMSLLEVVVSNKILLLGKEMEIQNNCFLKPGVHILLLIRCTCKSECTQRSSAVDSNSSCFRYN